jgi:hypothetical protein
VRSTVKLISLSTGIRAQSAGDFPRNECAPGLRTEVFEVKSLRDGADSALAQAQNYVTRLQQLEGKQAARLGTTLSDLSFLSTVFPFFEELDIPFKFDGGTFCYKTNHSNQGRYQYIEVDQIIEDFEYYGLHCRGGATQYWTWYDSAGVLVYTDQKSRVDNKFGHSGQFFSNEGYFAMLADNYDQAAKKRR